MTWQGENKDSCQVTIGVDVTGIEVSITVILNFHSNAVARDFSGHSHRVLVSSLFIFTLRICHFLRCVPPHAQLSLQPRISRLIWRHRSSPRYLQLESDPPFVHLSRSTCLSAYEIGQEIQYSESVLPPIRFCLKSLLQTFLPPPLPLFHSNFHSKFGPCVTHMSPSISSLFQAAKCACHTLCFVSKNSHIPPCMRKN